MKWLVRLWLTLVAACAIAIGVGRIDARPNRLQSLGFALCDDEVCYKGIKINTDWQSVQNLLPVRLASGQSVGVSIASEKVGDIWFHINNRGSTLEQIGIAASDPMDPSKLPSIMVGDIIEEFGLPCRVYLLAGVNLESTRILLYYPTLLTT